jgi:hypothetical protein
MLRSSILHWFILTLSLTTSTIMRSFNSCLTRTPSQTLYMHISNGKHGNCSNHRNNYRPATARPMYWRDGGLQNHTTCRPGHGPDKAKGTVLPQEGIGCRHCGPRGLSNRPRLRLVVRLVGARGQQKGWGGLQLLSERVQTALSLTKPH